MSAMTHSTSSTRRPPSHSRKASGSRSMNWMGESGGTGRLLAWGIAPAQHPPSRKCASKQNHRAYVRVRRQSVQSAESGKPTRLERRNVHLGIVAQRRRKHPPPAAARTLPASVQRIDQPEMRHASCPVDRALSVRSIRRVPGLNTSQTQSGARSNRWPARELGSRSRRQPARSGDQHVIAEMQLRLVDDPPAARARRARGRTDRRPRCRASTVARAAASAGPRLQVQRAADQLGHHVAPARRARS